jgi:transcriptional regulator GlxA family with amidase domain
MIDFAGPWEAFQDTWAVDLPGFDLFTVAPSTAPIHTSSGMKVIPDYSLVNAPPANVIVIPAQSGGRDPHLAGGKPEWLRERYATTDVIMSVCTGAFLLARSGLLDGLTATTHHNFYDEFEAQFPKVQLLKHKRYVDHGKVMTAGGLSSGIDGALHIIERFYDRDGAIKVAENMEYQSRGWIAA